MRELNKNHVYSLEELTSEQWELLKPVLNENNVRKFRYDTLEGNFRDGFRYIHFNTTSNWVFIYNDDAKNYSNIVNAKELFYTLENVQVDCTNETEERINNMFELVRNKGFQTRLDALTTEEHFVFFRQEITGYKFGLLEEVSENTTITYEKFMELFAEPQYDVTMIVEAPKEETFNPQQHYFNEPKQFRSLFELSHILELNDWEFDILKRLVRCRKKGQFAQDIQKIKDTADIYLNEFKD